MTFPVPESSRSAVNRAGKILINPKATQNERDQALDVLTNWRACHGYPMNTFQATLRERLRGLKFNNFIVAQRLKRMPTIIDKLLRFDGMELARMQDIGGLRVILKNLDEVHEIENKYRSDKRFPHDLTRTDNYIKNPKDDGYRSIHLVYRYKSKIKPEYNGLLLEFQIRTTRQHLWATAVETMGTYQGKALKSGEGEKKWRDFFSLASSAFAYIENTPPIPRYVGLDKKSTFKALAKIERNIDALNSMEGYRVALKIIKDSSPNSYYHLITLKSLEKKVGISSYAKDNLVEASNDYSLAEARAAKGEKIEPVLVSAGDLRSLKKAYPNYFLDVQDFIRRIETIIRRSKQA